MSFIVALGGTIKAQSSTERALNIAITAAQARGAEVETFGADFLANLPHFGTPASFELESGQHFVDAVRRADGILIASPGYHGSVSGLIKNAIDYLELLAKEERAYLDGRAVGLIATAYGHQAAMSTLVSLRTIAHALRGWPTPMGAAIRVTPTTFTEDGACLDEQVKAQLELVAQQTVDGIRRQTGHA